MQTTRLLFDENISARLVEFINREARLAEMAHISKLGWSGTEDAVWLKRATQRGFVIVTGDRNEKTRGVTTAELKAMGAKVILLGRFWDHMPRWERAKWMVRHIEKIVKLTERMQSGHVYLLRKNARWREI